MAFFGFSVFAPPLPGSNPKKPQRFGRSVSGADGYKYGMSRVLAWTAAALALALTACSAQQQQKASTSANDTILVGAVGTKIASIDVDAVTRVHVAANQGVITLTGEALSAQEKQQYEDAAKSVSGVTAVQDELVINPRTEGLRGQTADAALAARISGAIAGQAGVNAFHVQPSVHQVTKYLYGPLRSLAKSAPVFDRLTDFPYIGRFYFRVPFPDRLSDHELFF